ncbi:MAG: hypothetical protein Q4G03_10005 [Planctomycetia bacterium]|nr:hypothetical protein [Planctomycetia bacterium]
MELYDDRIHPYLIQHNDRRINHGFGFFIKEGTPPETIKLIREYHDAKLERGKPYFIMDFLAEDLEKDPDSIENRGILGFYRKRKESPKNSQTLNLPPLQLIKLGNLKRAAVNEPTVSKLIHLSPPLAIGHLCVFEIPEGRFTSEEIEILRKKDAEGLDLYDEPFVANFLPDDVRPAGIKKM